MTESTITTEQMIANAILWIEALKSGKYQKGVGALGVEKDGEWTYCCLGVGCKVLKVSTHPFSKNYVKLFLSSTVNPAVFSFPLGLAISIYL